MGTHLVGPGGAVAIEDGTDPSRKAVVDALGRLKVLVDGLVVAADTVDLDTSDLEALLRPVRNRFSPLAGRGVKVTSAGDTLLHDTAVDEAIRVVWVAYFTNPSDTETPVDVFLKLGAEERFLVPMSYPFAFAHGTVWEGAAGDDLVVNLSGGSSSGVYVNYELEEFIP